LVALRAVVQFFGGRGADLEIHSPIFSNQSNQRKHKRIVFTAVIPHRNS